MKSPRFEEMKTMEQQGNATTYNSLQYWDSLKNP